MKFVLLILLLTFNLYAQESSEKIYQSVLKATFTQDKIDIAKKFLKTNECKEGKWIQKILKDSNYWNREAGIYLVGECRNPKLDKEICILFIEDHMTRAAIRELIQKEPNRYSKILISIYKKDIWRPTKDDLFSLYQVTNDEDTSIFLQSIIQDKSSPDRSLAFKTLMKHSRKPDNLYFRSFLKDKELRKYSLQWIVDTGSIKDLELFRVILSNSNSELEEIAIACMAVQKWGDINEKKSTYLRFLKEDEQRMLPSAFAIFNGLLDEGLFKEISKLSRTGKTQLIRTEAILQIKNYNSQKKFPYIILFLQEEYQTQTETHIGDVVATIITFGIHGIFQSWQEKNRKDRFLSIQSDLLQLLQKETGEKFTDIKEWKAWATKKELLPISITYE